MTKIAVLFTLLMAGIPSLSQADCNYLLEGDLNRDCQVDFYDLSILAARWLVDCNGNPLDPGCRCDIPWIAEPQMNLARDSFASGVIGGWIYVFGGNGNPDGGDLKSTEVYDPAMKLWTMLADNNNNAGSGVEELTSAVVNDRLYVFGADKIIFNEMYDPVTNTWTTLAPKPTFTRAGPATVYNDEIYIFGGYSNSSDPELYNELSDVVECYNPLTNTWRFVTNMPKVFGNFGIAVIGDKAYLFGGAVGNEPPDVQFLDEVIAYDFQTNTWTITGYQPAPVKNAYGYFNSAPVIDGKVYLIGGIKESGESYVFGRRVDIYDPVTNTWEESTPLPLPLNNHGTLTIGGKIYVLGGCNSPLEWDFRNRSKIEVISLDTNFCSQ